MRRSIKGALLVALSCAACHCLTGCWDAVQLPPAEQLTAFHAAGPGGPSIDMDRVARARLAGGAYRVVPGDVLQVSMPGILDPHVGSSGTTGGMMAYTCRVGDSGGIVLPLIGRLPVAGYSLAETETSILGEYYPKYKQTPFPVYVSVLEYMTKRVSILGAVGQPGIYRLRHDQMSLVALLMQCGGIAREGAAVIRISRAGASRGSFRGEPTNFGPQAGGAQMKSIAHALGTEGVASESCLVSGVGDPLRLVFTTEGPLATTGWLVLETGEKIALRRWLDIGNESQRSAVAQLAAGHVGIGYLQDLEVRGALLADHLESGRYKDSSRGSGWSTYWTRTGQGSFVSWLGKPEAGMAAVERRFGERAVPAAAEFDDDTTTLLLPVRGLNIPFADVPLEEGDSVTVEWPIERFLTVVGLVNQPGNFPYPPDAHYTLIQGIAFAGGLDLIAGPRYVSVYRLQADGEIASVTIRLVNPKNQEELTEAMALPLKPGDVISVEHTQRTHTNVFFDKIFRISLGLYFNPNEFWNND